MPLAVNLPAVCVFFNALHSHLLEIMLSYFCSLDATVRHAYTGAVTDALKRSCAHLNPDGTACLARPQNGSEYCFFHDPRTAEKRHESQRQGGIERTPNKAVLSPDTTKVRFRGTRDVVKLAAATIEQVRCGQLEVRIANSIAQLAGVALKAMEMKKVLHEDAPTHVSFVMVAPRWRLLRVQGQRG